MFNCRTRLIRLRESVDLRKRNVLLDWNDWAPAGWRNHDVSAYSGGFLKLGAHWGTSKRGQLYKFAT